MSTVERRDRAGVLVWRERHVQYALDAYDLHSVAVAAGLRVERVRDLHREQFSPAAHTHVWTLRNEVMQVHAALSETLRRRVGVRVLDLSVADVNRADLLPTFLQSDVDVHGSHGLFYWLRARGRGAFVTSDDAGLMLTWRPDVGRLAAVRPVGRLDNVLALLEAAAAGVPTGVALVVRYCAADVAARLRERGWTGMRRPWRPEEA